MRNFNFFFEQTPLLRHLISNIKSVLKAIKKDISFPKIPKADDKSFNNNECIHKVDIFIERIVSYK